MQLTLDFLQVWYRTYVSFLFAVTWSRPGPGLQEAYRSSMTLSQATLQELTLEIEEAIIILIAEVSMVRSTCPAATIGQRCCRKAN